MTSHAWTCTIPGQPVGKGRPRVVRAGTGMRAFTPERTARWEAGAALVLRSEWAGPPLEAPDRLHIEAVFARPERLVCRHKRACQCDPGRQPHRARPDSDNLAKTVGDSVVQAGVVVDDARIPDWSIAKRYAAQGEAPHVLVRLEWTA